MYEQLEGIIYEAMFNGQFPYTNCKRENTKMVSVAVVESWTKINHILCQTSRRHLTLLQHKFSWENKTEIYILML